ncbi:hypothetical protein [Kribbella sp. NPDC051620]|uniref:hypothetical protein n=1 Tax=Kribbella sp. NPDC051620 TaxID=3364120 RepID=UPI00379DAABB
MAVEDEARSARAVAEAAGLLEESIRAGGEPDEFAIEQLERIAAEHIEGAETLSRQGFEPLDGGGEGDRTEADELDMLAAAVTQIAIGNTLLAASRDVDLAVSRETAGPELDAEPGPTLADALGDLNGTADSLDALTASPARQGFEPLPPSPNVDAAVDRLRTSADRVLDGIVDATTKTTAGAFTETIKLVPGKLADAIRTLGEKIELGSHLNRLVKLGLRAVQRGLDLFARMFKADQLKSAQQQLQQLYDRLDRKEPGPLVLAWLVGSDDVRGKLATAVAVPGVDIARVDLSTAAVERLGERFTQIGKLTLTLVKGIVGAGAALAILQLAVPHLTMITAGALTLVVGGIVLLALDYVGARPVLGAVRGVREVVADAVR